MARAKEAKPKRRGRPRLPPTEGKRYPLNMRTTKNVRDEVAAAAKDSGRSLAHEVESLVEQALSEKKAAHEELGGEHVYDMPVK